MDEILSLCATLGVAAPLRADGDLPLRSPIDGHRTGFLLADSGSAANHKVAVAVEAFHQWRTVPAPRRGELIRRFGEELRAAKQPLGRLVTLETGKILEEGRGEVQEMIDICDFAVGLSRQLHGLTMPSERPGHRMMETWHPLSPVGVITAFNFPVAVWAWNAAVSLVCGDPVVWKPSEKTPLTALACQALFLRAAQNFDAAPDGLVQVVLGGSAAAQRLAADARLGLVSATGSCRMGRALAPVVAGRLGRCLLELGGNNGAVITPSADLDLAVPAIAFAAVGTAGQRCTSLRRLIVHEAVAAALAEQLKQAFARLRIGDPRQPDTRMGPLIDGQAFSAFERALARARDEGGRVYGGARLLAERFPDAFYVSPALVEMPEQSAVAQQETFAPILYMMTYRDFGDAVAMHNAVPQGLASSIFTNDLREAETFLGATGSDCGIANVNIGPSGAEIGGAFGGEKASGGGREAGSDSWKSYMRRATNTINYSRALPLAQGIRFDLE